MAKYKTLKGTSLPTNRKPLSKLKKLPPTKPKHMMKVTAMIQPSGGGPARPAYGVKYGKIGPEVPSGYYSKRKKPLKKR